MDFVITGNFLVSGSTDETLRVFELKIQESEKNPGLLEVAKP